MTNKANDKDEYINSRVIKLTGEERLKPKPLTPKELTPQQRSEKRQMLMEHLDQLEEALHYAIQDVAKFVMKLDISHSRQRVEAERALEETKREISEIRRELSDLNAVV
jgi:hypothetical protein